SSGTCESVADVIVLDRPAAPRGPLEAEEVRADHVKVKWHKPEDDGGCELTGYALERMDEETGRWIPAGEVGPDETSFNFKGLTPNKKYKFRVKAINKEGESEPLETFDYILAKNPYDEPMKPGKPEIIDYDNMSVTLKWERPKSDGGRPITHYVIEQKDKFSPTWTEVMKTEGPTPEAKVGGLKEKQTYQFRVRAVNKAGQSEPSEPTDNHLCKHKNLKPQIDRSTFKKVILKAGRTHKWSVDVTGEPAPTLTWSWRDDIPLTSTERINIESVDYHTDLVIKNCKRNDTGKYKLKAENRNGVDTEICELIVLAAPAKPKGPLEVSDVHSKGCKLKWKKPDDDGGLTILDPTRINSGVYTLKAENVNGVDECDVEVTILDKPGKPEGPLEVSDVHKEGCKLKWKKPKDDGGLPLTAYVVEKMDLATGRWVPCGHVDPSKEEQEIKGLEPNHRYQFRVKAVNEEGESEPLETESAIVAKNPYDVASPPGIPEFEDWDEHHAGLSVNLDINIKGEPAPKVEWLFNGEPLVPTDENLRIDNVDYNTKFFILRSKRPQSGKYTIIATNEVGEDRADIEITVLGKPGKPKGPLEASDIHKHGCKLKWKKPEDDGGNEYQFRVVAVNKAGPSEPSDSSKTFVAKHRYLPPKIDRRNLRDLTISSGNSIKFDANIIGEPAPKVEWKYCGMPLRNSDKITIETPDYFTKLVVRPACRADSGEYLVIATNSSGQDSVTINVNVTDKPSAPEGPLQISDVHKNGCHLKWKRPKDDGGTPIEYYQIDKMDPTTGCWVPCCRSTEPQAEVSGLTPGAEYKFRVSAVNAEGESAPLVADETIIAKNPFDEPGKPENDSIDLAWTPPTSDGGSPVSSYIVEKKDKYGVWEKALEVPADSCKAKIPDLIEGQSYEFRVRAVNQAGPGLPSDATPPITAKPKNLAPHIDRTNLIEVKIKAGGNFNYDVKVSGEPAPTTKWLLKNKEVTGNDHVKVIHEPYNTKLIVKNADRSDSGTYTITAENVNGEDKVEVKVIVLDKPSPPNGPLKVDNVLANSCKLHWNPPDDDGGQPIENYVIEKMDEITGRWVPAGETDGPTTSFDVKGLTPNHKYKFRVRARNRQGTSDPLTTPHAIEAKNPFDIPGTPGKPEIKDYDHDFVELQWARPESDGGSPILDILLKRKTN
uniref:Twitchin n=1 Tax=Megaselia scalaris TaxID=36166 RepID=T1GCH3_MEGSC